MTGVTGVTDLTGVTGVGETGVVGVDVFGVDVSVFGVFGVFGVAGCWLTPARGLAGTWLLDWLASGSWTVGDISKCSESSPGLADTWLVEWVAVGSWAGGGCSLGSWSLGSPGGTGLQLISRPQIIGVIPRPNMVMARLQPCVVPSLDHK